MFYEDAFAALKDRDYPTAVRLLRQAARETQYASDFINHAYTLALYRAGYRPELASAAFEAGNSLLNTDPGSALDYFQRSLVAGLDAPRTRRIAELFEQWDPQPPMSPAPSLKRIAHVVGCVRPDDGRTRYLKMLVPALRDQGIESTIFTTEWAASWFFNADRVSLSQPVDIGAEVKVASTQGDFLQRAASVADSIRKSGSSIALFHSGFEEQITARVASMRPVPVQVHVNHSEEVDADLFDARIHLSEAARRSSRFAGASDWIPAAFDNQSIANTRNLTRQDAGVESAASISAGFGRLADGGSGYLQVVCELLKRFPKHFHLFGGPGTVKAIRSRLHAEGVLSRVRFLGEVREVAPLLNLVDVYLTPFPDADESVIRAVIGAGRPIVAMRGVFADLVGIPELTASGDADYIQIADQLIRNREWREHVGKAVRRRFEEEFHPTRLGERYAAFLRSLVL